MASYHTYRIRPNYRIYPYKCTVKPFRSLQITAIVLSVYFFIKAYVVGTHLSCIDLSMQLNEYPQHINAIQMSTHNICLYKEKQKNSHKNIA